MKNQKTNTDSSQTQQKVTEKIQAHASKNIPKKDSEEIIKIEVGMLIKAKWNKQVHKVIKITNKMIFYSEKVNGTGKIYSDSIDIIKECFTTNS